MVALCRLTIANLNPPAVHHDARHLGNLIGRTLLPLRKRQRLVRRGLSFGFGDPLLADPLGPALHPLARHLGFGERFEVLGRLNERGRLRPGVRDLPQHGRRERAIDLNADRPGHREKKTCGSKGKSTPVR